MVSTFKDWLPHLDTPLDSVRPEAQGTLFGFLENGITNEERFSRHSDSGPGWKERLILELRTFQSSTACGRRYHIKVDEHHRAPSCANVVVSIKVIDSLRNLSRASKDLSCDSNSHGDGRLWHSLHQHDHSRATRSICVCAHHCLPGGAIDLSRSFHKETYDGDGRTRSRLVWESRIC